MVCLSRHVFYEERRQRLGLHSLQRRRLQADLITTFKIFTGVLDISPNLFFLPPARRGLRGHPYKVLQGVTSRRSRGSAFLLMVAKYWNKLPVSVNVFKKRSVKVWTEVLPHLSGPQPPPLPSSIPHHPLTLIISVCYPTPCSIYVVSSGPLWPTFYHFKSLS